MLFYSSLIFLAALVGFASSWDVAVTSNSKLHYFNSNGTPAGTADYQGSELSALAYDATTDMLLLAQERNSTYTIYGITSDSKSELTSARDGPVSSVAYDPITGTLFWVAGIKKSRNIYKMSIPNGNVTVLKSNKEFTGIAVDSCGGYVYWAEFALSESTIKRSKFDGSNEAKVVDGGLFAPIDLAVDQRGRTLYWSDDSEGIFYKIESSDLQGRHRRIVAKGQDHEPRNIAVGDHHVFWTENIKKGVWVTPKNATDPATPSQILDFEGEESLKGLAVRYNLEKRNGIPSCSEFYEQKVEVGSEHPKLTSTIRPQKAKSSYISPQPPTSLYLGEPRMGVSSEISKLGNEKIIEAKSKTEYSTSEVGNEHPKVTSTIRPQKAKSSYIPPQPPTSSNFGESRMGVFDEIPKLGNEEISKAKPKTEYSTSDEFYVQAAAAGAAGCAVSEPDVRDPIIMALGTLCGLLCLACAVLLTKIMQLKKRPRIKKRIIVNKNVTPLTARPEQQCEITIENCCNMNICETPCFEPRSTIRPTFLGNKAGKEEKKNLIANMEHTDDMY